MQKFRERKVWVTFPNATKYMYPDLMNICYFKCFQLEGGKKGTNLYGAHIREKLKNLMQFI